MKIKSKMKRVKRVCGVEIEPGENSYKGLSLKNSVQRFKLLALRDAGMIDFKSDDKLGENDLPVPLSKEAVAKIEEEKAAAKKYSDTKAERVKQRKAAAKDGTNVQANPGATKQVGKNGDAGRGKGAVSDKTKNKSK